VWFAPISATPPAVAPAQVVSGASVAATKEAPFVNTLGMKFVPVPILGGPTGGQRVLFSVWDTRVQDYEVFATETKRTWPKVDFEQGRPSCGEWELGRRASFLHLVTERERKLGKLGAHEAYRLPSDHEWSCAVGIGEQETREVAGREERKINDAFPWGPAWPPPAERAIMRERNCNPPWRLENSVTLRA